MSENTKEFESWVNGIEKSKADFDKLTIEEQQKVLSEKRHLIEKMESSPTTFNEGE